MINPSNEELYDAMEALAIQATEAKLTKTARDKIPSENFGIPLKRQYPLIIPGDEENTKIHIEKAIQFFFYAKPEDKFELAENILTAANDHDIDYTNYKKFYNWCKKNELV